MKDENRAQKRPHLPSRQESLALYTAEFVPNFNSRKISISSWLFSSSFMCHPPAPPPPSPSPSSAPRQQSLNPSPRQQKPRRTRCRRTDGRRRRSRLVEEAQKNLELACRPTDTGLRRVLRRITRFIQSGASGFRPKIMKSPSNSVTETVLHYCVKSPKSSKPISVGHGAPCTPTRRARAQSRVRRERERER